MRSATARHHIRLIDGATTAVSTGEMTRTRQIAAALAGQPLRPWLAAAVVGE
jgi:hypothetical protein